MKFNVAIAATLLPSIVLGFPQLMGANSKEDLLRALKQREVEAAEMNSKRSVASLTSAITSLLTTIVSDVNAVLGTVATGTLDSSNIRPQSGYTFTAPGTSDSRGPCPGLNLLANYGYLPHNGYVTLSDIITATSVGFNMGEDLATILGVFSILGGGDITTESFYLGTGPGNVGGLNRHSVAEADVSPNREDFYLGCGDNHHVSSRLFQQNVALMVAGGTKQFDMNVMGNQYALNAAFSKKDNPYLYYFPFPQIVSLGAFAFYPQFFSNGTYGAGGVANYESISSIIGAKLGTTGKFSYVPEKWPTNWYRRATPYGALDALADAFLQIYPKNVIVPGVAQLGTSNFNASTLLCDIYQGINSITPLLVAGTTNDAADAITWALAKLDPFLGLSGTTLGCPSSVLSPDAAAADGLYPTPSATGGPINSPSAQSTWEGNNVYSKTYFTAAPTAPACSH